MEDLQKPLSPHLPFHQNEKFSEQTYYYFVIGFLLLAVVLLLTSSIFLLCFSRIRRFLGREVLCCDQKDGDMLQWIPTFRYMSNGSGGEENGDGNAISTECVVCISAFEDGEEVRWLPQCRHSFHAACIDMWLAHHKSCPLCRVSVVHPAAASYVSIEVSPDMSGSLGSPFDSGSSVNSV